MKMYFYILQLFQHENSIKHALRYVFNFVVGQYPTFNINIIINFLLNEKK